MTIIYPHQNHSAKSAETNGLETIVSKLTQALKKLAANIRKYLQLRAQRRENRDAFAHLLKLDDNILRDIGITREDVIWASKLPLHNNAALELEKIAQMSRCNL